MENSVHTDQELLTFNNQVAHARIRWWELHQSAPGHDQDELFLQFDNGSVVRIVAEHRDVGATLKLEAHSRMPIGRPVRNLPAEYNERAIRDGVAPPHVPTAGTTL